MARGDLTDAELRIVEPLLPAERGENLVLRMITASS